MGCMHPLYTALHCLLLSAALYVQPVQREVALRRGVSRCCWAPSPNSFATQQQLQRARCGVLLPGCRGDDAGGGGCAAAASCPQGLGLCLGAAPSMPPHAIKHRMPSNACLPSGR